MNPDAEKLWRAPQWAFAALLSILGMLGPFSIDTYLPAFAEMGQSLQATPASMQQTLSAYLFGFSLMSLFHGALSDSVGRRPVVLCGLVVFTLASVGCALSQTIDQLIAFRTLQGLSTGAGIVVSRAVVRDMYAPAQAQQVMSQITLFFGLAPALAPLLGGWLLVHAGWHAVFWFLSLAGVLLWLANYFWLPETLALAQRQSFHPSSLLRAYFQMARDPRFLLLALASGMPFNGLFLYVLSAPVFLGQLLGLAPEHFYWFFMLSIGGIMAGAWVSGRVAGRHSAKRQIGRGFAIMLLIGLINLLANLWFSADVRWALLPLAIYAFGWATMVPVVTLLVLDLNPARRGMASSLQMFISSLANGVVAGVLSPLVMHSTLALAAASLLLMGAGLLAWCVIRWRWPDIGLQPMASR